MFRAGRLYYPDGGLFDPSRLPADALAHLLLNEYGRSRPRPYRSPAHRFSYQEDFVALTWESALVVEPDLHDEDVEYVLDFAPTPSCWSFGCSTRCSTRSSRMYERVHRRAHGLADTGGAAVPTAPRRAADPGGRRDRHHRAGGERLQGHRRRVPGPGSVRRAGDLRGAAWRQGIDRKLGIMRETSRCSTPSRRRSSGGTRDLHRVAHRAGGGAVVRPRLALKESYEGDHR